MKLLQRSAVVITFFVLSLPAFAQGAGVGGVGTAQRFTKGASLPAACVVGQVFYNTATTFFYGCGSANTWTVFGSGSGSGTITPSPQYQVGIFPTAGTNATVQGSTNLTTDAAGDLSIAGNETATTNSTTGAAGGLFTCGAGLAAQLPANSIGFQCPEQITAGTEYAIGLPEVAATGIFYATIVATPPTVTCTNTSGAVPTPGGCATGFSAGSATSSLGYAGAPPLTITASGGCTTNPTGNLNMTSPYPNQVPASVTVVTGGSGCVGTITATVTTSPENLQYVTSLPAGVGIPLSDLTAAGAANTINNGDNAQVWNWSLTTASKVGWTCGENVASVATGNPVLCDVQTLAGSTAHPFQVTAHGTSNGWRFNSNGLFLPLGSGDIATGHTAHTIPVSEGTAAIADVAVGATNTVLNGNTGADPSFGALPIAAVGSAGLSGTSPITAASTGAIGCATCIVASSPGAGIARFAGSTQTVTSAELSGDATTSGSNAVTVVKVNGASVPAAGSLTAKSVLAASGASSDTYQSFADLGTTDYVVGGGSAQAQTATLSPVATALTSGLTVNWLPVAANTSGAPTLAVNGLTATAITKCGTTAVIAGDIALTAIAQAEYDGTQFQLLNPQATGCPTNGLSKSGTYAAGLVLSAVGAGNTVKAGTLGVTSQKSESAADTNVLTVTPAAAVGNFRACITISVSAATAATLGWTMTWTDSNGTAQAPTNLMLFQDGTALPALTFATGSTSSYSACKTLDVNNAGTAMVVKLTFTGTSFTAKVSATIERLI